MLAFVFLRVFSSAVLSWLSASVSEQANCRSNLIVKFQIIPVQLIRGKIYQCDPQTFLRGFINASQLKMTFLYLYIE